MFGVGAPLTLPEDLLRVFCVLGVCVRAFFPPDSKDLHILIADGEILTRCQHDEWQKIAGITAKINISAVTDVCCTKRSNRTHLIRA